MAIPPPHPYQRANITLTVLSGFALLLTLLLVIFNNPVLVWISLIFLGIFGLLDLIIWLLGRIQIRRAQAFLVSNRPLVCWIYSAAEWQQLKEEIWQEESEDWKLQWGCLIFLLALAGALTGAMLGFEEGILQIAGSAVLGFGAGALLGGLIGALVAGGNYWGARLAYGESQPGQVALGPNEIYINGDYFKGDGVNRYIEGAKILPGRPPTLEFQLVFPPRPRLPREEQWSIPIPANYLETIENNLADFMDSKAGSAR